MCVTGRVEVSRFGVCVTGRVEAGRCGIHTNTRHFLPDTDCFVIKEKRSTIP